MERPILRKTGSVVVVTSVGVVMVVYAEMGKGFIKDGSRVDPI